MTTAKSIPSLDEQDVEPFKQKLDGEWELVLLEKGTCTYRAGGRFAKAAFEQPPKIIEVDSFQEAMQRSQTAQSILLLPHLAVPHVVEMETDPHRTTLNELTFRYSNPPLYLASHNNKTRGVCAAISHLNNLALPQDGVISWRSVENTQVAAETCSKGETDLCITNEHGLKKYNLKPIRELKKMQPTWFAYRWRV